MWISSGRSHSTCAPHHLKFSVLLRLLKFYLYAGDVKLYRAVKEGEGAGQLENDLEVLCNWTQSSLRIFNLSN